MSPQAKRDWSDAMTWILRGSTAIGAFFIVQVYTEIKEMHRDVEAILRAQAVTDVHLDVHTSQIGDLQRRTRNLTID